MAGIQYVDISSTFINKDDMIDTVRIFGLFANSKYTIVKARYECRSPRHPYNEDQRSWWRI
jgi:hypothetical protein